MNLYKAREYFLSIGLKMLNSDSAPSGAVGNLALAKIDDIFLGWFVGEYQAANPYLPRALKDIENAIANGENFGMNYDFHQARLHSYRALAIWGSSGVNSGEVWNQARLYLQKAACASNVFAKNELPTAYLDDYIAYCYLAGEYQAAVDEYRRYHGEKPISLRNGTPKEYGCALCLRALDKGFATEDFLSSGRRVLKSNLARKWLGKGQISRSVLWLNIAYWEVSKSSSPLEAVLKAFDDMPDIQKPF